MVSDGTRVFIVGGISSLGAQVDEITLTHVFGTSTYLLVVISFGQPPSLKTQSTSRTPDTVNPCERAIPEELDRAASLQITREGPTEYHVKFAAPNASER
jgi:hypothetical protein